MNVESIASASLPSEIWVHIFAFLDRPAQLAQLALVCTRWRTISEDDMLWSPFFASSSVATAWLRDHQPIAKPNRTQACAPLKRAWAALARVEANWLRGTCKLTVVQLPLGHAVPCSLLDEPRHRLILGTMATTLELVDLPPHGSEGQGPEMIDCIDEPQLRERTAAHPLHNAHRDAVRALKMSPDRRLLASASNDHTVRVWDAETLECLHTLTGHTDSVRVLTFAAHNSDNNNTTSATILLSAGRDHTVKIWDADKGQLLHSLRHTMPSGNTCMAHAIEANDTTAAVGYADGSIALVCLETGQVVQLLSGHTHWITSLHMRPGLLVSGSCDRKVIDWDLRTGQPAHVFEGHTSDVNAVLTFGPANERIVSCSNDGTVRVWSRTQGSCIQTLAKRCEVGHVVGSRSRPVNEVIAMQTKHYATRPDVTTLISGNTGKVSSGVRLWELDALGERAASLHSEATEGVRGILSLAVSARYLVATTWDCKVLVCDFGRGGQSIRWAEEQDNTEALLEARASRAYVPPWQRRQRHSAEPDCREGDRSCGPDDYTPGEDD